MADNREIRKKVLTGFLVLCNITIFRRVKCSRGNHLTLLTLLPKQTKPQSVPFPVVILITRLIVAIVLSFFSPLQGFATEEVRRIGTTIHLSIYYLFLCEKRWGWIYTQFIGEKSKTSLLLYSTRFRICHHHHHHFLHNSIISSFYLRHCVKSRKCIHPHHTFILSSSPRVLFSLRVCVYYMPTNYARLPLKYQQAIIINAIVIITIYRFLVS